MVQEEIEKKLQQEKNFFKEIKALAEKTKDPKTIHQLIQVEDIIHGLNISRDFGKKKPRFETLSKSLMNNKFITENDLICLFEVLNGRYEMSTCTYKEYIKSQINKLCVVTIKRGFINAKSIIFANHPNIKRVKEIAELLD